MDESENMSAKEYCKALVVIIRTGFGIAILLGIPLLSTHFIQLCMNSGKTYELQVGLATEQVRATKFAFRMSSLIQLTRKGEDEEMEMMESAKIFNKACKELLTLTPIPTQLQTTRVRIELEDCQDPAGTLNFIQRQNVLNLRKSQAP